MFRVSGPVIDAAGAAVSDQFRRARGPVAVAVRLLLQNQNRVGMHRIRRAIEQRVRAARETELQPFRRNRRVCSAARSNLDPQITVQQIPRLHRRRRSHRLQSSSAAKPALSPAPSVASPAGGVVGTVVPVRFAARARDEPSSRPPWYPSVSHAFREERIPNAGNRNAVRIIRRATIGLKIRQPNVLRIARSARQFVRVVAQQNANLRLVIKPRFARQRNGVPPAPAAE